MRVLLILFATLILAGCTNCTSCTSERVNPEFMPGEMVKTKFGAKVLIIDTLSEDYTAFHGSYHIKRSDSASVEQMSQAELESKI